MGVALEELFKVNEQGVFSAFQRQQDVTVLLRVARERGEAGEGLAIAPDPNATAG